MEGPYRERVPDESVAAATRDGPVRVESSLDRVRIELGARFRLEVAGDSALWVRAGWRPSRERRRALDLAHGRLWVARAHPTRDLALWFAAEPDRIERLGGVRPVALFDPDALAAWRALDRAAAAIEERLARWAGGVTEVTELGKGAQRVLLVRHADRLTLHARSRVAERHRPILEVTADGTLVVPGRGEEQRGQFRARSSVSVWKDRLVFAEGSERPLARIRLPGLEPEDRQELATRLGHLVDPPPPEPPTEGRRLAGRIWASGLGRASPISRLLPGPLPLSALSRHRR